MQNKIKIKAISFLFIAFLIFNLSAVEPKKPWTFLVYIAGDNDLEQFIDLDLNEMKDGANNNVHALAFVNTHRSGQSKLAKKLVITKNRITQDGPDLLNLDSGIAETVIQAANWAIDNYPSDKLAIILWDHGSGSLNRILGKTIKPWNLIVDKAKRTKVLAELNSKDRGVCYDYTTGSYLNDYDLKQITEIISKKRGKKIEIVAFDACLMANIELTHTIKQFADFLVASQETIAGTGWEYKLTLKALETRDLTPRAFAQKMVKAYDTCYKVYPYDYTLSATDLNRINFVVNNLNKIAKLLISYLKTQRNHNVDRVITLAGFTNNNIRFDEPDYIDLYSFYLNLYYYANRMGLSQFDYSKLRQTLQIGMYLIRFAVTQNATSPRFSSARGISVYLPKVIHPSYEKLYWATQTQWLNFLKTYIKAKQYY